MIRKLLIKFKGFSPGEGARTQRDQYNIFLNEFKLQIDKKFSGPVSTKKELVESSGWKIQTALNDIDIKILAVL
jgi:hypothetical protein